MLTPVKQRTLQQSISVSGISLHGGDRVEITLHPAPADTGIIFRRVDVDPAVEVPAKANQVKETMLQTVLDCDGTKVGTVEHLLSALAGMGIDNLYVDVTANEIPIMDGSSSPFIYLLQSAGVEQQNAYKRFIKLNREIRVELGDKWASLKPYNGFKIIFTIDFTHPAIKSTDERAQFEFSCTNYIAEVSRARTFGFVSGIETLQQMGLAKGGSLDNAIGLDDYRVLNEEGLRFDDEFIKHKILDAIGDLYLLGAPILAEYEGFKSGHAVNNALCLELLKQTDAWEYVTFDESQADQVAFMAL